MTAEILAFPGPRPDGFDEARRKAVAALRSCLERLAEEARDSALPFTAEMIEVALLSLEDEASGGG